MARGPAKPIIVFALLLGTAALVVQPAAAAGAPAALLQAVRAPGTVAYRGEQIVVMWDDAAQAQASLVRIEHDPPAWTQLDYFPVGPRPRWTDIRRGTEELRFDPVLLTGTTGPPLTIEGNAFETAHLPWLLENYLIGIAQTVRLGRRATQVELVPGMHDRPTRRLDVDEESGVVLRSESLRPDGSLGEMAAFLSFEIMPVGWRRNATIPTGLHLTPRPALQPASAEDVVRVLGGPPVQVVVPQGFHKMGEYITGEGLVIQTIYSDGVSTLVVYQRRGTVPSPPQGSRAVTTASGPVWVQKLGLRSLVHWAHAGRVLTMVGEVSRSSLQTAAEHTGVASTPRIWDRLLTWLRSLLHGH